MKCLKKNKLELAAAKEICINAIDIIGDKAICSDGKICSHSKEMKINHSFTCSKCADTYLSPRGLKILSNIFYGDDLE